MILIKYLIGYALAFGLFFLLSRGKTNKNKQFSGGFFDFVGANLKVEDLLHVLVLEELARYQRSTASVAKSCKKRVILTVVYIILNFLLLMLAYNRPGVPFLTAVLAMVYAIWYHCYDPVETICKAAKQQPEREISQIVLEMTSEELPRKLSFAGVGAFVLSLAVFIACNATERYAFAAYDNGYSVANYNPGIFAKRLVQIPETYEGRPVVAIGKNAFNGTSEMVRVKIPETVVVIDSFAFKNCTRLAQIQLPAGLQVLNGESFKGCKSLREMVIPEGVTEIRGNTFEDRTALKTVVLHDGIIDIHAYAFRNCVRLAQITLPPALTEIHAYTFENCTSLREIEIPVGVTRIAAHAFYGCSSLRSVFVPDTVREIRSSAFRECASLREIELPDGVIVDERAFLDSPTKILKKVFTDGELEQIIKAAEEKVAEKLYYVYDAAAPDRVKGWNSSSVLIADDVLLEQFLELENIALCVKELESNAELLAYLEKAKAAGFTNVVYGIYSPMASEIIGAPYFVSSDMTVEDMMEACRQKIAEENNG